MAPNEIDAFMTGYKTAYADGWRAAEEHWASHEIETGQKARIEELARDFDACSDECEQLIEERDALAARIAELEAIAASDHPAARAMSEHNRARWAERRVEELERALRDARMELTDALWQARSGTMTRKDVGDLEDAIDRADAALAGRAAHTVTAEDLARVEADTDRAMERLGWDEPEEGAGGGGEDDGQ